MEKIRAWNCAVPNPQAYPHSPETEADVVKATHYIMETTPPRREGPSKDHSPDSLRPTTMEARPSQNNLLCLMVFSPLHSLKSATTTTTNG